MTGLAGSEQGASVAGPLGDRDGSHQGRYNLRAHTDLWVLQLLGSRVAV